MQITITHNGFHGHTSTRLRIDASPGQTVSLSPGQLHKLRVTPCGMSDCHCGESMLSALRDYGTTQEPHKLTVPASGTIAIRGHYPQH